jgi:penicillin-binding protein 1A
VKLTLDHGNTHGDLSEPQSVKKAKRPWYKKLYYENLRLRRSLSPGLIAVVPVAAVILYPGFQSGKVNSRSIESVPQMEEITKVHDRNGKGIFEFYQKKRFNRAVHARRQPGSAFKPFVYATALKLGMTPSSKVQADSLEFMFSEGVYQPVNADGAHYGSVSLRTALRKSINTAAVRLGQEIGLQNIVHDAHKFGISGELRSVASLPLGTVEVTLMEMVRAYSAFPNGGNVTKPSIISRVEDKQGRTLYAAEPAYDRVLDERIAFLMTTMLADAVDRGTGTGVRAAGYRGPMGGKTGTTNDYRDAWFIGFTPDVVTGVWVGFDAPREILNRGYGASLAVPIWARFMKQWFSNSTSQQFSMPAGVVRIELCVESGLAATSLCRSQTITPVGEFFSDTPSTYWEYFLESKPPGTCVLHQPY